MKELLALARKTIEAHLDNRDYRALDDIKKRFSKKQASFVTLTINGELRGCIGSLIPNRPLYEDIQDNAINAAFRDPRFPPINKDELKKIKIEISILSIPERLSFNSTNVLLKKLNSSLGVILKKGYYSATYLPQVWEHFEKKEDFLSSLCIKAGLSPSSWQDKDIEILTYKVDIIKE